MAPCNCGGGGPASVTYNYVHTSPEGAETIYTNEYEARAAVLRDGGSWKSQPKAASFSGTVTGKSNAKI